MPTTPFLEASARFAELWWSRHGGPPAARNVAAERLRLLVRYAREYSPFHARLYDGLPADPPLAALPATDKASLMRHFDDWSTDRRITLAAARAFLADRRRVGERFLDRYWIWKSSGTSGRTGIFVQDDESMAVYDALVAAQLEEAPWSLQSAARAARGPGRAALVVATGDHFASLAAWERMRRLWPLAEARSFSALAPLPRLARELEAYDPTFLAGYPSSLAMLARECAAGRVRLAPALAWTGGEGLTPAERAAIERGFGCGILNEYGASECLSIAHECRDGWQHLHAEWALLEPVDRDGLPVPPGTPSHSVLLTNLANWTQPVIRYDLGDRITMRTDRCGCGNPLPAFRLQGRTDDTLALRRERGEPVRLSPLAVTTVVEDAIEDTPFQVAQLGGRRLAVRLGPDAHRDAVRRKAIAALRRWLDAQGLPGVEVLFDPRPLAADPRSGKVRRVVVESACRTQRPR